MAGSTRFPSSGGVLVPLAAATAPLAGLLAPFTGFLRSWDYRPSTSWFQHFITINANLGDAAIEQKVLGDVGSYGYQINRLLDAVNLLVSELKLAELSGEQQRIVVRLQDLAHAADVSARQFKNLPIAPD